MKQAVDVRIEELRYNADQIKAIKSVFRGRKGKLALELLEKIGHVHKSTYVKNDPQGTALNEGTRQIVLKIKEFISMSDIEIERKTEDKIKTLRQYERGNSRSTTAGGSTTIIG